MQYAMLCKRTMGISLNSIEIYIIIATILLIVSGFRDLGKWSEDLNKGEKYGKK